MPPPESTILPTHTALLFQEAVRRATELLRRGEVVALPTETVYGLAANALDAGAVQKIFSIKGRPSHNPIIVHVASYEMARACVSEFTPQAMSLAKAFWPGPLTLVLPKSPAIPSVVTAGGQTVGIRWPSHPFMQEVIRSCGFPLAAPSANESNRLSPTSAAHVASQLGHKIPLIIDGGQSNVGIESTVIDLSVTPPRFLRPGMIAEESISAVVGSICSEPSGSERDLKSPGLLPKHYAPKARLICRSWSDEEALVRQVEILEKDFARVAVIAHTHVPLRHSFGRVSVIPHDAEAFARAFYAELHECDAAGADLVVVEDVPRNSEWRAIRDRLKRAAG